jgi:hypothetical protein
MRKHNAESASLLLVVSKAGITYTRTVERSLIFLPLCCFLLLQPPPPPLSFIVCEQGILTSSTVFAKLQTGCQPCIFLMQFVQ